MDGSSPRRDLAGWDRCNRRYHHLVQPMSRPKVRQLPESEKRVPFEMLAAVDWPPERFLAKDVEFRRGHDNLDEVNWALLQVGRFQVVLQHHLHSPTPSTEILRTASADPQGALQAVVDAFEIPASDLIWLAPGIERPRTARP